ncbi:MAG: hypothetical protein EU547_03905 [Promethearchaeota archaeon]|nr:MAG: hypothetical protein EU547_03905 [Candidatus Lokiarchaeota archaeon]
MADYESIAEKLLEDNPNIHSVAIIKDKTIKYNTKNWKIEEDLIEIKQKWGDKKATNLKFSRISYRIFQNTSERLVAKKNNSFIVGVRNNKISILCKLFIDKNDAIVQIMSILSSIGKAIFNLISTEPFFPSNISFSRGDYIEDISPKFLFDTIKILERLGLKKFGLSSDESKVYMALLKKGETGEIVGNLNKELAIKRTTIYRIINRLIKKDWVIKGPKTSSGIQIYIARPINRLVNKIIEEKEEEIKILKSYQFLINEYFRDGFERGSHIYDEIKSFGRDVFDINVMGFMGLEKDFGIIIFEYEKNIADNIRARDKLDLVYDKIKEQLKNLKRKEKLDEIGSVEEYSKIEYQKIENYEGANIFIKFKKGSKSAQQLGDDWVPVIREVAIPIDNIIYVIWGSEEKFKKLLALMLNLKQ